MSKFELPASVSLIIVGYFITEIKESFYPLLPQFHKEKVRKVHVIVLKEIFWILSHRNNRKIKPCLPGILSLERLY